MTRKSSTSLLFVLVIGSLAIANMAGCNREPAVPAQTIAKTPPTAPATQPPPSSLSVTGPAHLDGYGDMRFGMNADEAKKAWGGDLNGTPGPGALCYFLMPKWVKTPTDFRFMMESDKFVRYDVGTDKEVAPGGGKRGMSADEIRKLYAGHVKETPHKYIKGGLYLRIKTTDPTRSVLLFETDAGGKVTSWRVGQAPQVDYVEGCS